MQVANRVVVLRRLASQSVLAGVLICGASTAWATGAFVFGGKPIHPACVHAIAMQDGDRIPVARAISLAGCEASDRTRSPIQHDESNRELLFFEDEALLGEGTFGYRHIATLDNGVFILGIRRVNADGELRYSLAALDLLDRPTLRNGDVVDQKTLEMIGEIWLKDTESGNVRTVRNKVHYTTGLGRSRVDRTIDFSRITRARRR